MLHFDSRPYSLVIELWFEIGWKKRWKVMVKRSINNEMKFIIGTGSVTDTYASSFWKLINEFILGNRQYRCPDGHN